jgi:hypothetical protein
VLDKFKVADRAMGSGRNTRITFDLPWHKAVETVIEYQTISKNKTKLNKFEKKPGSIKAVFAIEEPLKARVDKHIFKETGENLDNITVFAAEKDIENMDKDGDQSLFGSIVLT